MALQFVRMISRKHNLGEAQQTLDIDFLTGGGEMGERIRRHDWAATRLGTLSDWPMSLQFAVSLCVKSQSPISIYWGWPEPVVLYNDAFIHLVEEKHPAALGAPLFESWPELRPVMEPILESVMTTGKGILSRNLLHIHNRNGFLEERYYTVSFNPIMLESGRTGGVFCFTDDTTDPIVDEQNLRTRRDLATCSTGATEAEKAAKSETELEQIVDAITICIGVVSPDGVIVYTNKATRDYTGVSVEEARGHDAASQLYHPEDNERLLDARRKALLGVTPFTQERRVLGKNGHYRWFHMQYNPVFDDQGHVARWYVTATDIDERVRMEETTHNENLILREQIERDSMYEDIVGSSTPLRRVLSQVSKVAPADSTVLILGETGTGKELIARAIHKGSKRSSRAFIAVNCAAITPSLIASELFGHEKGAFTGAAQRRLGRFAAANGGTIFLDEIGDLPQEIQIALLRVLQEREIERVGSDRPIPIDVRVVAATHRDLKALVSEGKFRQDLLYRLNVVPVQMPSLRERAADIPLLVEYFVARFGSKAGKKFRTVDKRTLKFLQEYEWPGNVRELQNVIERAVILNDSDCFAIDETWLKREPSLAPRPKVALSGVLLTQEKEMIEAALAESRGRVYGPTGAAAKLGLPARSLDSKIERLGIDKYRFKSQKI